MPNKLIVNQMPSVLDLSVIKDVNGNPITLQPKGRPGASREVTSDAVMHEVVQRVLGQRWVTVQPAAVDLDVLEAPLVPEPKRDAASRAARAEEPPPAPPADEPPPLPPIVEEPPPEPPPAEEPIIETPPAPAEETPTTVEEPLPTPAEEPAEEKPAIAEPEPGSSAKTTAKLRRDRR